jgi:hypothetical protein
MQSYLVLVAPQIKYFARTGRSCFFRGENGDLGGSLVKILSECKQEVPEFLQGGMGGNYGGQGTFGGVDIRGGAVAPQAAEDDW